MKNENMEVIVAALDRSLIRETARISEYIDTLESPSDEFFAKLDERFNKIKDGVKKQTSFKKIIVAVIAATLAFALLACASVAYKEEIKGFFVEFFDGFAMLSPEDDLGENKDVAITDVSIGYIPEGFEEIRVKVNYRSAYYEWALDDKCITLLYNIHANGYGLLDTDDSSATEIIIGDKSVWRTERFGQISATWTDGKIIYSLGCTGIEWEEIVKIIEGIICKDE